MPALRSPRPVHLVGSVPLSSARDVFETVGSILGPLVKRIPDGETGVRLTWIGFQGRHLRSVAGLELLRDIPVFGGPVPQSFPLFGLKPGVKAEQLDFYPLGYAAMARESYAAFKIQRAARHIPDGTRFQVSLPTPTVVVMAFIEPKSFDEVLPVYERDLKRELADVVSSIPARDLAIQWDIAGETELSESPEWCARFGPEVLALGQRLSGEDGRRDMMATVARMVDAVPPEVEVGLHYCYGDPEGEHLVQPRDASVMVDLANRVLSSVHRPIQWIHMPVPIDRTDDAFFVPLSQLEAPPKTELFLGLVHLADGIEGARARLQAASKVVPHFGIACECGLGRKPPERIPELLTLHRDIAAL
jgi:hypothetical protein